MNIATATALPIDQAVAALQTVAGTDDADAIAAATEALNHASSEFAARRMDKAVQTGLAGHKVEEIG